MLALEEAMGACRGGALKRGVDAAREQCGRVVARLQGAMQAVVPGHGEEAGAGVGESAA